MSNAESSSKNAMEIQSPALEAILLRLLQIKADLEAVKPLYEEYDKLVLELQSEGFDCAVLGGDVISVVDNFANGVNTAWKACGVKRFDLRVETLAKHEKRIAGEAEAGAGGKK